MFAAWLRQFRFALVLVVGAVSLGWVGVAQDRRQVSEPRIPAPCVVLPARLVAQGWTLAEADESRPDTARIQQALDHCLAGQAVELKSDAARDAFLSGPLTLRSGVTLLVDKGVILFASRNPRDYDLEAGVCGTVSPQGHACKALLTGDHIHDAAVMGDGIIDGRGGAKLLGQNLTWWDVADKALKGGLQNNFRMLTLTGSNNFTLYRIQLKDSPNFHVTFTGGDGFTVWGVVINAPANARNLDGIDLGQPFPPVAAPTTNITVAYSFIHAGDDILAAKAPETYPTSNITVMHNHFYTGHGMSIGSATTGGVSGMRVDDLSIDGAENGVRIKSNVTLGGAVHDIEYKDVCIRNSKNPIGISTHYDSYGPGHEVYGSGTNHIPEFRGIRFEDVAVDGGKVTLDGLDETHRLEVSLHNVLLTHPETNTVVLDHAAIRRDGSNIAAAGADVVFSGTAAGGVAPACAAKFVPFPAEVTVR
jgi:polygalacturonase